MLQNIPTENIVKYLEEERGLKVSYHNLFSCDIRFKEDCSPVEKMVFAETNIQKELFELMEDQVFFYMKKQEAIDLLGVEDNGLDFHILKVY